jgi:hypothetical protein
MCNGYGMVHTGPRVIGKAWFGDLFGGTYIFPLEKPFEAFWNQGCGIGNSRYVSQIIRCDAEYGIL